MQYQLTSAHLHTLYHKHHPFRPQSILPLTPKHPPFRPQNILPEDLKTVSLQISQILPSDLKTSSQKTSKHTTCNSSSCHTQSQQCAQKQSQVEGSAVTAHRGVRGQAGWAAPLLDSNQGVSNQRVSNHSKPLEELMDTACIYSTAQHSMHSQNSMHQQHGTACMYSTAQHSTAQHSMHSQHSMHPQHSTACTAQHAITEQHESGRH